MPLILKENTNIVQEVCLHHLSDMAKTPRCKTCQEDYDLTHNINNYSCPDYDPRLQINYNNLIKKIEEKRKIGNKGRESILMWTRIMNSGYIDCKGHEVSSDEIIKDLKIYLGATNNLED